MPVSPNKAPRAHEGAAHWVRPDRVRREVLDSPVRAELRRRLFAQKLNGRCPAGFNPSDRDGFDAPPPVARLDPAVALMGSGLGKNSRPARVGAECDELHLVIQVSVPALPFNL